MSVHCDRNGVPIEPGDTVCLRGRVSKLNENGTIRVQIGVFTDPNHQVFYDVTASYWLIEAKGHGEA
jgi:hypothetical protein